MSLLIKGIKMPQNCLSCRFLEVSTAYGDFCVLRKKTVKDFNSRLKTCPLIELPLHGRLIDADEMVASVKRQTEIMREIAKEVDKLRPIANSKELDDVDIVAIAETVEKGVLQEIANAPTILEAEVEE